MSHFAILVVGENVDEQLAPYEEGTDDDKYLQFIENEVEEYEKYTTEVYELVELTLEEIYKCLPDDKYEIEGKIYASKYAECFRKIGRLGFGFGSNPSHEVSKERIIEIPMTTVFPTFEEYMEKYCGHESRDAKTGLYGYWRNPKSKWDWYQIGGRYSDKLKLKQGAGGTTGERSWTLKGVNKKSGYVDSAHIEDIDFEGMYEDKKKEAREWYKEAQNLEKFVKNFSYGIKDEDTEESYMERVAKFSVYAVLKEGQWYEKGEMGWWGISSNEMTDEDWERNLNKFLKEIPPGTLITIVDCHI